MAKPAVDISLIGDKELERALKMLPDIVQKRVVMSALKKSANEAVSLVTQAVSGNPVGVDTGRLLTAIAGWKPSKQTRAQAVVYYLYLPERIKLGIAPDDKWYYPLHVEYGYIRADGFAAEAKSFLRRPIDQNRDRLIAAQRNDINKGIVRNMKRLAKK